VKGDSVSGRGAGEWSWERRNLLGILSGSHAHRFGAGVRTCVILVSGILLAPLASAEEEGGSGVSDSAGTSERVERPLVIPGEPARGVPHGADGPGLDALLQLPRGFMAGESRAVAGAGEAEWRRRFSESQRAFDQAGRELAETKRELDSVADGGGASTWSMAPPGGGSSGGPSSSPLSFKLRQELKEKREQLEAAERAVRELRIEADLAGVPANWRGNPTPKSTRSLAR